MSRSTSLLSLFLTSLFLAGVSPAQVPGVPTVQGAIAGPRTAVFGSPHDSCSVNDFPDAMPRAFRDSTGTIHFSSASSVLYQSLGPTLESLEHSCDPAYSSVNDPKPADFNDQAWLDSFYTLDGVNIAALAHTEYHGWAHPGECHTQNYGECEYDSDTYHFSDDGGYHFRSFAAPHNFLAGIPYPYKVDYGPMGYSVDTNIISYNGWYYAVATAWTWPVNCTGTSGPLPCVTSGGAPIRTKDVFDPTSWRGWNGSEFSLMFVDPYAGFGGDPLAHVYTPVPYMFAVNGIYVYEPAQVVVALLWDYWDNELGEPGLYLTTSTDLVNWTAPKLVVSLTNLEKQDPAGSFLYPYFSLIDPASTDRNFATIGEHPYLYYVRLDNNGPGRVVFRQPLTLTAVPPE